MSSLEGDYLHYDKVKRKWIRSGKVFGAGEDACFRGRETTHAKTFRLVEQMREHQFYREYPARRVANLGGVGGCFENLEVHCGIEFDKKRERCIALLRQQGR